MDGFYISRIVCGLVVYITFLNFAQWNDLNPKTEKMFYTSSFAMSIIFPNIAYLIDIT